MLSAAKHLLRPLPYASFDWSRPERRTARRLHSAFLASVRWRVYQLQTTNYPLHHTSVSSYSISFAAIRSRNQKPLSLIVRFCVSKSV